MVTKTEKTSEDGTIYILNVKIEAKNITEERDDAVYESGWTFDAVRGDPREETIVMCDKQLPDRTPECDLIKEERSSDRAFDYDPAIRKNVIVMCVLTIMIVLVAIILSATGVRIVRILRDI
jgi:hypothetical protein